MANFTQKTLNMAAGNGYVVALGGANTASVIARAACYVQISDAVATPTAPTATPAPSAGLQASYIDMQAGEVQTFGSDDDSQGSQPGDFINYLVIWAVGTGNLVINAH